MAAKRGNLAKHIIHLRKREEIAERTMAFHLERPPEFEFHARQFIDLMLLNPPDRDSQGAIRTFTLASALYEEELVIATRIRRSAYKRMLSRLPEGAEVQLEGPMGSFLMHKNPARARVCLAGGIGITPFRSFLWQAAEEGSSHPIYLFYSNRRPEGGPFLRELQDFAERDQ